MTDNNIQKVANTNKGEEASILEDDPKSDDEVDSALEVESLEVESLVVKLPVVAN